MKEYQEQISKSSEFLDTCNGHFQRFLHTEAAGGIILVICTISALVWANVAPESYDHLWHTHVGVTFGEWDLSNSLAHWINDGLMVVFFFVIGLEVKREFMVGELANPRNAIMPLAAALGGMMVPALIYFLFNTSGPGQKGWGVPMATDIAFCLGILSLFGKRVPGSIKIFLAALAIADDLGAILVIAIFYSGGQIVWLNLIVGGIALAMLITCNRLGVRNPLVYAIIGIGGIWLFVLQSGVHATVAGILAALAIPARQSVASANFILESERLLDEFEKVRLLGGSILMDPHAQEKLEDMHEFLHQVDTPLSRLERRLHPWVSYVVLPLFALANAGVVLKGDIGQAVFSTTSLGIILGLAIGKPLGVFGFSWLTIKVGLVKLPETVNCKMIMAASCLAGIGFTMSLFIASLAFGKNELLETAKLGVLVGSAISGALGIVLLFISLPKKPPAGAAADGHH